MPRTEKASVVKNYYAVELEGRGEARRTKKVLNECMKHSPFAVFIAKAFLRLDFRGS